MDFARAYLRILFSNLKIASPHFIITLGGKFKMFLSIPRVHMERLLDQIRLDFELNCQKRK